MEKSTCPSILVSALIVLNPYGLPSLTPLIFIPLYHCGIKISGYYNTWTTLARRKVGLVFAIVTQMMLVVFINAQPR